MGCQVRKLRWGSAEPLTALGLKQPPDFMLAADVLYGSDSKVRDALVETIRALSGINTVVVIASVNRLRDEVGSFYDLLSDEFELKLLPQGLLYPTSRTRDVCGCQIHVLRRKDG